MATQVILLERIEKLGAMGDIVDVKPGFARNYLLPQSKALRATKDNIAYFETQKAALEKTNNEKKKAAETHAKGLDGLKVVMIRQAGETGQLYGSVTARDIADAINEVAKDKIERNMVTINNNIKTIGLIPVEITLHPEVKLSVTVNIARTDDEAATQEKTGKALVSNDQDAPQAANDSSDEMKADLMEADALEAEKAATAEAEEKAAEDAAKSEAKSEARAEKKAAAAAEAEEEAAAEEASTEDAPEAEAKEEAPEAQAPKA